MRVSSGMLIGGVLGVLIGGFAAGVSVYVWLDAKKSTHSQRQTSPVTVTIFDSPPMVTTKVREARSDDFEPSLSIESVQESLALDSDFYQSASLYLLLSRADQDDLDRYIDESLTIASKNQRNAAFAIIFRRYAALNPYEALDKVQMLDRLTFEERSNLVRSIFNEWTANDFEGAVAAIDDVPDRHKYSAVSAVMWRSDFLSSDQRIELAQEIGLSEYWISNTVSSIRSEAAKSDPRSAFYERIHNTTNAQPHYLELMKIIRHWVALEGADVASEINDSIEDRDLKQSLMRTLIWSAIGTGEASPIEMMRVVSEFPNQQDAKDAMELVFDAWSESDAKQSFESSFEFGDQLINRETRKRLLHKWARNDADSLLDEATSLPREYKDIAVVIALGRITSESPEKAIGIAQNLDSRELRVQARNEIVRRWSYVDAKNALAWLINDGFNIDDQNDQSIFTRTLSVYLNQDFDSAERFVGDYQGVLKDQFTETVARHLVNIDVEQAIDYLPNVNKDHRNSLRLDIGRQLVEVDPLQALSFGKTVEQSKRDRYYDTVLNTWSQNNFFALYENLQRVPAEYRKYAAKAILSANEDENVLSEREIQRLEAIAPSEELQIISAN